MAQNLAFVCSEFNKDLVSALYEDARKLFDTWQKATSKKSTSSVSGEGFLSKEGKNPSFWTSGVGAKPSALASQAVWQGIKICVPGAGEIPQALQWLLSGGHCQAALALAVIIKGKTAHFDFLCGFLQKALWDLQKTHPQPLVFSILMTETRFQAEQRIKQSRGAKDMQSLLQMINLKCCDL